MALPAGDRRTGPGQVITFYSYKGGTGRTMALANVGWILASNGHRVLTVDWDLESPGLHRFYHPLLGDPQLHASEGVIDLLRDFAAAAVGEPRRPEAADLPVRPNVRGYAVSVGVVDPGAEPRAEDVRHGGDSLPAGWHIRWRFANGGELDLLPAGRQGPAYSATVSTFDWPSFYERLGGAAFLAELRENFRAHYDFVLIDSRTGLSDSAGICTVLLPDMVVNCFTLSNQSIDGAAAVARSIRGQRIEDPVRILPVPMRVEEGEQSKLDAGRDYARARFAPFLEHLDPEERARYWADVEIPYKLFYAYEEILAVFGDRAHQPTTLLAAYERLARVVSGDDLTHLIVLDEQVRRYWLARFERRHPRALVRPLITYAAEERLWAEWIADVLGEVGLRAALRENHEVTAADLAAEAEGGTDLVVVLLSAGHRPPPEVVGWSQRPTSTVAGRVNILPISLDGTPAPEALGRYGVLELSGMSEERARSRLLSAVNWPIVEPPMRAETGRPRFPATPPPLFRLPLRNTFFTGRRQLLADVRERLVARAGAGATLAITGLGGVGKTQLATEYAYRFAGDYDVVWWVSAAQGSMIRAGLVDLADELRVPTTDTTAERIRLLLEALQQGRPYQRWLLIFDSVGEVADLEDVLPAGPGHVLITSRWAIQTRDASVVEVAPFGRRRASNCSGCTSRR
ncbi:KGGVGR-motif variant AAA ATPase [Micromonospora zhanjiangensis]